VRYKLTYLFTVVVCRGGTTLYIHGTGFSRVREARLIVTMIYTRLNGSENVITRETNFTSNVRKHTFEIL